ncbi:hypothetical protein [Eleftheria terrae]|uniref:hypothetical protein n=1 Tax=Eleftheria terrae TaxID=1597781 RepID=UPI00263B24AF|nr:hypothetical protein [Eleftheria terrae]WKB55272.1 hypothetical protein N7L95_24580 [Eleftheria terrae]
MKRQHLALGIALAATLLAAYFAPQEEAELVAPVARSGGAAPPSAASAPASPARQAAAHVLRIRPRDGGPADGEDAGDWPFARAGWSPAPAAPVPAAAATVVAAVAAPAAPPEPAGPPPLPFTVLGRYAEAGGGEPVVFLQHNDESLVVRVGDTIAEHYKVEGLEGGVLTLLHLPTNQRQTLDLGSGQGG